MVASHPFAPTLETAIAHAGFWRRLAAYLIDLVLLTAIQLTLAAGVFALAPQAFSSIDGASQHAAAKAVAWDITAFAENAINLWLVSAALTWAYYSILESSPARATIGKAVMGIFVGDAFGDPITFWRASLRHWLKTLSSLLLMVGWLMAAFTPRKQALHDLLAGTLVLRKVDYVAAGAMSGGGPAGEYWDGVSWVGSMGPAQEG